MPLEKQLEVLDFVKFIALRPVVTKPVKIGFSFKSVRGTLKKTLGNLESDLAEIRREIWGGCQKLCVNAFLSDQRPSKRMAS